ncbi:MAG TPA: 2-oxoacid:acceptor oxidoreductase subunit alpha [Gaiellaceae bacterium]|nr:2-oxoacid:acceptor oxidoreductase subunit alpha [Gaiellaceae bacterium]
MAVAERVTDLNVMVGGQGGDGSLTLVGLVADLLGRRGYHLYESRDVGSRIKGGCAAGLLRASTVPRGCLGDRLDLLVAFDREALERGAPLLRERAWVVHDSSDGPAPRDALPPGATVVEAPFGRLAVRDLRRDLYKNSLAFGVVARVLGLPDGDAEQALRRSLRRLPARLVEANVQALRRGLEHAGEAGLGEGDGWRLADGEAGRRLLLSGNDAVALGFLAAGGRFFAGYPITPATEILDRLLAHLPAFGGTAVQCEDELAAVNMAIGAALTGVRAMTASSGPGIALMQEGIGQLGSAEIGVVVVDCQRAGPSTGMPTKPEQSDLGMLVHGANGDFPRIVLAPADPAECFELTALAVNLAERLQGPVYVALDQAVAQDAVTVDGIDLDAVTVERGKLLGEADLARLGEYRRYSLNGDGDGISPWAPVGACGGCHLVTGNEHDEWGRVSADPGNRVRMVEKRLRKLDALLPGLPRALRAGDPDAEVVLAGFGMNGGVLLEAADALAAAGLPVQVLRLRTLWPVLGELAEAAERSRRVYLVEQNATGQYARVLAGAGLPAAGLESVLRFDGRPFRPAELARAILEREEARA